HMSSSTGIAQRNDEGPPLMWNSSRPENELPTARAPSGPDFICIGMPKAGTGWLSDQLQFHPDFWMPPVKSLHYLDLDVPEITAARRQLARFAKHVCDDSRDGKRRWGE